MSWKCEWFGHKFSGWLEDTDNEFQERWCKRCQFLERLSLKLYDCERGRHNWGKWIASPAKIYIRRTCIDCGFMIEKRL